MESTIKNPQKTRTFSLTELVNLWQANGAKLYLDEKIIQVEKEDPCVVCACKCVEMCGEV